ncbi:50S ribosomal protein 6 chloroplastic [Tripterygium wilfordii]|uniref:50S ribosomal protein 6 chloroplastic n=2 Tax=Tripterygium wilfordii TaxID=458696 RepID=A0A7J7D166_TRIWF|nr:50S ribosomal protein 6 chloroplastic [Tripterygium wilfordii]
MSISSSIFGSPLLLPPKPSLSSSSGIAKTAQTTTGGTGFGLLIECSSRPQKKATAHHMKTRPRKSQPWDIRRKPTVYPPLPPLPSEWTLVSSGGDDVGVGGADAASESAGPSISTIQASL